MKKTTIILATVLATTTLSCIKESPRENEPAAGKKVTIRVSSSESIQDETSKVTLTEAADRQSIHLAWESTDKLSINGNEFSVKSIVSDHEAEFEGTEPEGSSFTIIYPGAYASAEAFNARSYASQAQTGNASTAHLEYNAMLSGVSEWEEPKFDPNWAADKGGSLIQNGVIHLRLQLPEGTTTATSVILSASRAVFPTTNSGDVKVKEQTISLSSVTLPANRILQAFMMFSSAGVAFQAGDQLTVAVETPTAMYFRTLDMTAQTWTGGGQYTIQCKVNTENSFTIEDADDLEEFRDGVNSGSFIWQTCSASLANDIDCSSIASWTPIGNGTFTPTESGSVSATWTEPAFKGTFNGNNHAIQNLDMTASPADHTPYGLFGILYGATVKNLTLGAETGDSGKLSVTPLGVMDAGAVAGVAYGSTVQTVTNYYPMTIPTNSSAGRVAMGMVGYVYGDATSGLSTLSGLNNRGKVEATQSSANTGNGATGFHAAGIAGFSNTGATSVINSISSCTNYAAIETSTGRCAGILGAASTRTAIESCNNRGNIKNTYTNARVGGITVILSNNSTLSDCHNYKKVEVTGSSANVGGLVCLINNDASEISQSSNEGTVEGSNYVGGIASNISAGTITECVNTGDVTGSAYVGGIVGRQGANSGWAYVNKCRSNATVTATSNTSSCAGGIAGQVLGGVLNTCSAKGSVEAAGYDVGGIVGQMYCNQGEGGTYGRQYVYDCLAAADVTTTRTSAAANLGGVVGRIIRKNDKNNTGQYMAIDNCIGLNQKLSAGARTYVGAFVGQVTAGAATNHGYVRVRNNISLVEDANVTATSGTYRGGFVGGMPYGLMYHAYYLVSDNSQTIGDSGNTTTSNITKSDATTLTGAAFCSAHSTRATSYMLNVNDVAYKSSGWTIPTGCSYPVPKTLADLGEAYYK